MRMLSSIILIILSACTSSTPPIAQKVASEKPEGNLQVVDSIPLKLSEQKLMAVCDKKNGNLIYIVTGGAGNTLPIAVTVVRGNPGCPVP